MENSKKAYLDYIQSQKHRLEQGLPPLGPEHVVKNLSSTNSAENQLKFDPNSHVQFEGRVGDIHLKSYAPGFPYYVIFKDDGEVAYFYAAADTDDEDFSMLDGVHIYNTQELADQDKTHLFEVIWSEDGLKSALLINKYFHAVFDFESFRGYSRTNFPPVDPDSSFGEYPRAWSETCTRYFRNLREN